MAEMLHIFAVNQPLIVRHTHLTRLHEQASDLPPLDRWTGMAIDLDNIELFPIADLEGFALSSYVEAAFAVQVDAEDRRRLDALRGHVLLVVDGIGQPPAPDANLSHIAALAVAQPDHSPQPMPAADATGALAQSGPPTTPSRVTLPAWLIALALGFAVLIGLIVFL